MSMSAEMSVNMSRFLWYVLHRNFEFLVRSAQQVGRNEDTVRFLLQSLKQPTKLDRIICRRCLELLYFIAKCRRNKLRIINLNVIETLLQVFLQFYSFVLTSITNSESEADETAVQFCLIVLSCLKILSKIKSGKERIMTSGTFTYLEGIVRRSLSDSAATTADANRLVSYNEILDAVCNVCLRCLPSQPFPLAKAAHCLNFALPLQSKQRISSPNDAAGSDSDDAEVPSETEDGELASDDDENNVITGIATAKLNLSPSDAVACRKYFPEISLHSHAAEEAFRLNTNAEKNAALSEKNVPLPSNFNLPGTDDNNPDSSALSVRRASDCSELRRSLSYLIDSAVDGHTNLGRTISNVLHSDQLRQPTTPNLKRSVSLHAPLEENCKQMISTHDADNPLHLSPKRLAVSKSAKNNLRRVVPSRRRRPKSSSCDTHRDSHSLLSPTFQRQRNDDSHSIKHYPVKLVPKSNSDVKLSAVKKASKAQHSPEKTRSTLNAVEYSPEEYLNCAAQTLSVIPFCKAAFPDLYAGYPDLPLQHTKEFRSTLRLETIREIELSRKPQSRTKKIVFDLDAIVKSRVSKNELLMLKNDDESMIGRKSIDSDALKFESRFESGNLRRAVMISQYDYELYLNADINQLHLHHQWFYFQVSNMEADVPYTFRIVNMVKGTSQFGRGMQPVIFSVKEALSGRPGWARSGQSIAYYKNRYLQRSSADSRHSKSDSSVLATYSTLVFTVAFRHACDICYVAYHFPYTYSMLQVLLAKLETTLSEPVVYKSVYYERTVLCHTLSGNPVPLLTVSGKSLISKSGKKPYVILTGRVHPGESNASWIMHGVLTYLLSNSPKAAEIRDNFIFKIIPMLNPDGVVNGSHRCSLSGQDLNRQWLEPDKKLHPTVASSKLLFQFLATIGKTPFVFCDFHGHSKRKNIFLYGNNCKESWLVSDRKRKQRGEFLRLAELLDEMAPCFNFEACRWSIEHSKETTARIVAFRQFKVQRAYTLEATFCGCDRGPYKGFQIGTKEMLEMGERFCDALLKLKLSLKKTPKSAKRAISKQQELAEASSDTFYVTPFNKEDEDSD